MLDLVLELVLVVVVLASFGDGDRPFAMLVVAWLVIALYESSTTAVFGGTLGKRVVQMRVVALDVVGPVPWQQAAQRGAANAAVACLGGIGWISTLVDPLGRGIADRAGRTMVVRASAALPITSRALPGYADHVRAPRRTALGRVGDLDVRVRARLRRLVDVPLLSLAIGLLALAASLPVSTATLVVASSAAWIVVFVVDETRRVRRHGTTPGHHMAGLVIRDHRTGGSPGTGRSLARAVVLGLTLYVPVLWPLLAVSFIMIRTRTDGRGLHDLAGATVVVADPTIEPELQRQMAMRMRVGQAG